MYQNYKLGIISLTKIFFLAAHCIHEKNRRDPEPTRKFRMRLGAYNLDDSYEHGASTVMPSKIIVHEDWDPFDDKFDADIAMIFTVQATHFTRYIKPICLINFSTRSLSEAWAVGWGKSEDLTKDHENFPKKLRLLLYSNENCFLKKPQARFYCFKKNILCWNEQQPRSLLW